MFLPQGVISLRASSPLMNRPGGLDHMIVEGVSGSVSNKEPAHRGSAIVTREPPRVNAD